MRNHWDYLRFDGYSDVFIDMERDCYVVVECEPYNWAYLLCCREYTSNGAGKWFGGSCEYIQSLEPLPYEFARMILRTLKWVCGPCEDEYSDNALEYGDWEPGIYFLDYQGGMTWTCPHCGCSTSDPESDGCWNLMDC